jgi:hypothetical protein
MTTVVGSAATTDAERGEPSSTASSPMIAPGPRVVRTTSPPCARAQHDLDQARCHDDEARAVVALVPQVLVAAVAATHAVRRQPRQHVIGEIREDRR